MPVFTKANQRKLNEYVDFEFRAMLVEITNQKWIDAESHAKHFEQIGVRLSKVKGLSPDTQNRMVELTKTFTIENFFEFGKMLVGVNPRGILTMQQVLSIESDLVTQV